MQQHEMQTQSSFAGTRQERRNEKKVENRFWADRAGLSRDYDERPESNMETEKKKRIYKKKRAYDGHPRTRAPSSLKTNRLDFHAMLCFILPLPHPSPQFIACRSQ